MSLRGIITCLTPLCHSSLEEGLYRQMEINKKRLGERNVVMSLKKYLMFIPVLVFGVGDVFVGV